MTVTTTQRYQMAAADVARVRNAGVMALALSGKGSWSIPCTPVATFHKPEPRRHSVPPS